jgi:signal transduction histidine kinase
LLPFAVVMAEVVQILLVEHDPERRRGLEEALARSGWRVTGTASGDAAMATLARSPEAVVVLGPALPDATARELLARLLESHPETPIVVAGRDDADPSIVARVRERRRLVRERNRLREEAEALGLALQGTTDGVAILATGGRIAFVNRALAAVLQTPAAAVAGRPLGQFVRVPGDDHGLDDVLVAIAGQGRWNGVLQGRATEVVWEVSLTPLDRGGGRTIVGIFRDVGEKHAVERLRADFLSMLTHDIKVPLAVILGYAEMLADPEPPPGQVPVDVVTRIRESGEQIHALVSNFLDLSRIEAGRFIIDPRPFDVRASLERVLEQHAPGAQRRGVALSLAAGALVAVADEGQIERVVTNLLANAIKYTASGGRVAVQAWADGERIVIVFADTGRGIPAAELPHLFERYRRVREAHRTEGTGLGLFIAKTIVDAHGGEIHVESTPGVGSTFTVVIPSVAQPEPR